MNKIYTREQRPFLLEIPDFYSDHHCDLLHYQYMSLQPQTINNMARQCLRRSKIDHEFAKLLYNEIEHHIPAHLPYGTGYQYRHSMNAQFTHALTSTGQQFKPHMDGSSRTPSGSKLTRLTFMLYLSTPEQGATQFHDVDGNVVYSCKAVKGKVLLFSHEMQHSGQLVKGCKAIIRNDIFYA